MDNLLEDNDTSQRRTSQTQHNYNFDLSGPKLQINPNNLDKYINFLIFPYNFLEKIFIQFKFFKIKIATGIKLHLIME